MAITFKFILNTVAKNKPGNVPRLVMLRITSQRAMKYVDTQVYATPDQFNPDGDAQKKNWIRRAHPQHELLNTTLAYWHNRLTDLIHRLIQTGGSYTSAEVKAKLLGRQDETFSAYIEEKIAHWQANSQDDNARNHQEMLNKLREFMTGSVRSVKKVTSTEAIQTISAPLPTIELAALTPDRVREFDEWLMSRPSKRAGSTQASRRNTATDLLRRLRQHIIPYIARHGLPSEADPTRGMRFATAPTNPTWLTEVEIQVWEEASWPIHTRADQAQEHARVLFLAAYYLHGIRIGDIISARVDQVTTVREMVDGQFLPRVRFRYVSDKKDKPKTVLVEPFLQQLLRPYLQDKEPDAFIFPFLPAELRFMDENRLGPEIDKRVSYVNTLFKEIAKRLGTNPNVSGHTARRSFADHLYDQTNDLGLVQHALGHGDITTTQRYIAPFKQQKVDQANQLYKRHPVDSAGPVVMEPSHQEPAAIPVATKGLLTARQRLLIHAYEDREAYRKGDKEYNDYMQIQTPKKRTGYAGRSPSRAKRLIADIEKIKPYLSKKARQQAERELATMNAKN